MYKLSDYIYNGLLMLNNNYRHQHKKLSQLMIYATTACQSRCKHCSIWQKEPEHLSLKDIQSIVQSNCVNKHTTIGLEGGEFVLHPQASEILDWFHNHHPNYTLLSNGLATMKVIDAVRRYTPLRLYISLDGNSKTYNEMRGCNGHDKVIQLIETLRNEIPISLMFCLSPWNTFKDMEYVINIAKKYSIDIRIGIYGTMAFFDTTTKLLDTNNFISQIPKNIYDTQENFDFVALYNEWRNGHLNLRCHSIFSCLVVHSNGDVPVCQNLEIKLGNIHTLSLDEIFNNKQSCATQCHYSQNCNACWINFHRKYDIILLRNLEKIFPKWIIEKFYGKYSWTDNANITYRKLIKSYNK